MGFHARFKAVITLAVFSKTIRHFDAVIVCCMIYDLERKSLFMFFFCLRSTLEWVWQHDSFFLFHKYFYEIGFTSGTIRNDWTFQNVLFFFVKCLTWTRCSSSIYLSVYLSICLLFFSHRKYVKNTSWSCDIYWRPWDNAEMLYIPRGRCLASVMFLSSVSVLGWAGKPGCCATQWFSMHLNYCSHLLPGTSVCLAVLSTASTGTIFSSVATDASADIFQMPLSWSIAHCWMKKKSLTHCHIALERWQNSWH